MNYLRSTTVNCTKLLETINPPFSQKQISCFITFSRNQQSNEYQEVKTYLFPSLITRSSHVNSNPSQGAVKAMLGLSRLMLLLRETVHLRRGIHTPGTPIHRSISQMRIGRVTCHCIIWVYPRNRHQVRRNRILSLLETFHFIL